MKRCAGFIVIQTMVVPKKERKKERKSIHPLKINTNNNYYNRLNECDTIRKMLKTNCKGNTRYLARQQLAEN